MNGRFASTVNEYLSQIQWDEARASLLNLRAIILEEIPDAEECISYGMPGYKLNGYICGFAAFKNHCSFFPGGIVPEFSEELKGFKSSKGTIQFHPNKPIPEELVRTILRQCVLYDSAKQRPKKK